MDTTRPNRFGVNHGVEIGRIRHNRGVQLVRV
jgi:hypothetical protein